MSPDAKHSLRIQGRDQAVGSNPGSDEWSDDVRAWLTALVGSEHLSLLVGSGLGAALSYAVGVEPLVMDAAELETEGDAIDAYAKESALSIGRGKPNLEDQLRAALQLINGLDVLEPGSARVDQLRAELGAALTGFANGALSAEQGIREAIEQGSDEGDFARDILIEFLLAFAFRAPSRERLNVFTTNYDRIIEYGSDLSGMRILDRFAGAIAPKFRASRLDLDLHYNPPGIRGEPRFIEGVFRLSKLHGSLDWEGSGSEIRRVPLEFGADKLPEYEEPLDRLMIYPNAAKDAETLFFPYAELFRDFSASVCRPNSVLFTFGYGFGDDHVNRVLRDMLSLPSTHLAVISFDDAGGRVSSFVKSVNDAQVTLLMGPHFGSLEQLVQHYLPKPGTEALQLKVAERSRKLAEPTKESEKEESVS